MERRRRWGQYKINHKSTYLGFVGFSFSLKWVEAKRFSPQESKILRKITRDLCVVGKGNEIPGKGRWKFHK